MASAEGVAPSSAALASAERIAQLKRLQRRVGGLRSTLPVSNTDDMPTSTTHATDPGESGFYSADNYDSSVHARPTHAAPPPPQHHGPLIGDNTEGDLRFAAALGSLLSYIRSAETSPEGYIDPSYFRSGYSAHTPVFSVFFFIIAPRETAC